MPLSPMETQERESLVWMVYRLREILSNQLRQAYPLIMMDTVKKYLHSKEYVITEASVIGQTKSAVLERSFYPRQCRSRFSCYHGGRKSGRAFRRSGEGLAGTSERWQQKEAPFLNETETLQPEDSVSKGGPKHGPNHVF